MRLSASWRTLALGLTALALLSDGVARAQPAERTLIVVLDAVPYATMERLTNRQVSEGQPLFTDFAPPVPLISTFPSSTSIALSGILGGLGLDRSPGYEPRFFDWEEQRRRGGGPLSYFRITFPWREFFDWNRKGPVRNFLHAARPVRAGIREIGRAIEAFKATQESVFTVYVADTDTAAHLFGPTGLDPMLRALDRELKGLDSERIILLSDHGLAGGEPLVNVLPAVRRRIADRGWRWAERLEHPGDVVLTPYGLVSSFEAYADPDLGPMLAGALAGVEGVEFCILPKDGSWRVAAGEWTLDFERRQTASGSEWSWRVAGRETGLAATLPSLGAGSWVSDRELLAATGSSAYPDALYRLAGAFGAVENPASVVCSVEEGYMFGSRGAERSARWAKGRLRWTHGALGREASFGFLMSNRVAADASEASEASEARGAPPAVRFDRALELALAANDPRATSE